MLDEGLLLRFGSAANSVETHFRQPRRVVFRGPTPSVSASGTRDAIVWIIQTDAYKNKNAILRAYDAALVAEVYRDNHPYGKLIRSSRKAHEECLTGCVGARKIDEVIDELLTERGSAVPALGAA